MGKNIFYVRLSNGCFWMRNILGKWSLNFPTQGAISSNIWRHGNDEKMTMTQQKTYLSTPPCQPGIIVRPTPNNFLVIGILPLPL